MTLVREKLADGVVSRPDKRAEPLDLRHLRDHLVMIQKQLARHWFNEEKSY